MKVIVTTPYSKALTRTGTIVGTCKRKQFCVVKLLHVVELNSNIEPVL